MLLHNVLTGEQPHIWLTWALCSALPSAPLTFHPSCHLAVGKHRVLSSPHAAFISGFQFLSLKLRS